MKKFSIALSMVFVFMVCFPVILKSQFSHFWLPPTQVNTPMFPGMGFTPANSPLLKPEPEKVKARIQAHLFKHALELQKGTSLREIFQRNAISRERTLPATGSISGVIYESDGVTPVQNSVIVEVYDEYGFLSGSAFVLGGSNGQYSVDGLVPGNYYVHTYSDAYINEYYDDALNWQEATLVNVPSGGQVSGINFSLRTISQGAGLITGSVFDPNNVPIAFLSLVLAVDANSFNLIANSITNQNGQYALMNLPPADYILAQFYQGGQNYTDEIYDGVADIFSATVITVQEDTVENVDFTLQQGALVSGTVNDNQGQAITQDVTVYLHQNELFSTIYMAELSGTNQYTIGKILPGEYAVFCDYEGQEFLLDEWYQNQYSFASANRLMISPGQVYSNINFQLDEGGAISGNISDENGTPITDCAVEVYDPSFNWKSYGIPDLTGHYVTEDPLPPGEYRVYCEYFGSENLLNEWYDDHWRHFQADLVMVNPPAITSGIDFVLNPGGAISGQVFDPMNNPLSYNASVLAFDEHGILMQEEAVDFFGQYTLKQLPPGQYRVLCAYQQEDNDYVGLWYPGRINFQLADPVTVLPSDTVNGIDFQMQYAGKVQGFVLDDQGNPLSADDYPVITFAYRASDGEPVVLEATDGNNTFVGGYRLILPPNDYKIQFVPGNVDFPTAGLESNPINKFASQFYPEGLSFDDPLAQAITVNGQDTLTLNSVMLDTASGGISGTVYDARTGQPIENGFIAVLVTDTAGFATGFTIRFGLNLNGAYTVYGLRPGTYYALALGAASLSSEYQDLFPSWYDGVVDSLLSMDVLPPRLPIPPQATPIVVGNNILTGIDFMLSPVTLITEEGASLPRSFALFQNYPNPFNAETIIPFQLSHTEKVRLEVFNILGQKVVTLMNKELPAGRHFFHWNGTTENGASLASGIYFYRLTVGDFSRTRKLMLLR